MEKRHILIGGQRGVGKSTLINKLIKAYEKPVYGFLTKNVGKDEKGFRSVYIYCPDDLCEIKTEEHLVAYMNEKERYVYPEVFDTLGVSYLEHRDGIIIMDELGFLEKNAKKFQERVLACLDGDVHVIAAVKEKEYVDFLDQIRNHPKAEFYHITQENRDVLCEQLLAMIQQWNRE